MILGQSQNITITCVTGYFDIGIDSPFTPSKYIEKNEEEEGGEKFAQTLTKNILNIMASDK